MSTGLDEPGEHWLSETLLVSLHRRINQRCARSNASSAAGLCGNERKDSITTRRRPSAMTGEGNAERSRVDSNRNYRVTLLPVGMPAHHAMAEEKRFRPTVRRA